MKSVLIAHQSTIPHYRVPFFNMLEHLRPDSWCFDVVFDPSELKSQRFFEEPLDVKKFEFPILETHTLSIKISNRAICYQTFWSKAGKYDLVVVENAVNNLVYPLCHFHQITGARIAYWGHGKDRSIEKPSVSKFLSEKLKLLLARTADGFFAYTAGVKSYLEGQGLLPEKIFSINNTIDINEQRDVFNKCCLRREAVRQQLGLQGKKVLLFVGRFTKSKRIDFLLESFEILQEKDSNIHLLLVGSGGESRQNDELDNISFLGSIVDLDRLGPIFVASDVFTFPGAMGLAPLQALCYDLPVITIDSSVHKPEFEYLSPRNSIVLRPGTTPEEYAEAIIDLFKTPNRLKTLRLSTWSSIKHLTIEQMAQNFIRGVNSILDL